MHLQSCVQGFDITCEHVRKLLTALDPACTEMRLANKCKEECNAKGPNYMWNLDEYDLSTI